MSRRGGPPDGGGPPQKPAAAPRVATAEERALWDRVARSVNRASQDLANVAPTSAPKPSLPLKRPIAEAPSIFPESPSPHISRTLRPQGPPTTGPTVSYQPRPQGPGPVGRRVAGLDAATTRRLSRGDREPDARIDLHGMTTDRAHQALIGFILREQRSGARLVLVITGKGGRRADPHASRAFEHGRGVLKTLTPEWLSQPPLGGLVVGVYKAHRRHGGDGALYVYLRKNR